MESAFRLFIRILLVTAVLALLAGMVWAQGTGEITGLMTDPSGAVVAGATVTLTNTATGEKRTTVTGSAGIYRFSELPVVGTYTLQTSPKGFKSMKVSGIVVSVGTVIARDLKLELGATTEQVTVEAGAEVVQTSESAVSQLVDRRTWEQMPLQIRNQNSFIELVAGAVPQDGSGTNRGAEVNGTRSGAGSYLVEGADNNEQGQAGRGQISPFDKGGASTSISPDAIQEYRVITNSYSAEYGKGGGFITDTVLKGGTNQWHGSAFEYNRIQALVANDWFSNQAGIKDSLVRNQFGGSIGGPIIKDKTFFYGTAELHRVRYSQPYGTATVTTPDFVDWVKSGGMKTWAESDPTGICNNQTWWDNYFGDGFGTPGSSGVTAAPCTGKMLPNAASTGPIFNTLLASPAQHFPLDPNATDKGARGYFTSGVFKSCSTPGANPATCGKAWHLSYPVPAYGSVTLTDPQSFNEERWSLKMDHRFSEKDTISGVYLYQNGTYTESYNGGQNFVGPSSIQDGKGQNFGFTWNHTFSTNLLNTLRLGYLRHRLDFPAPAGALGVPAYYTIDGLGADFGQYAGLPQYFTENQFQYMDTMSLVKGKHSFKFGGEFRRIRNGSRFYNDTFGSFYPWSIEDTLTDLNFTNDVEQFMYGAHYAGGAYLASAAVVPSTGQVPQVYRGFRANEFAGFVQDDWRLTSRFTVNLGLRWEYFGPPHNFQKGIDSNFYFGSNVAPINQLCKNPAGLYVPCNTLTNALGNIVQNPFFPASNPFYAGVQNGTFQVRNAEIWNKDTNNFGPRVGFAWDTFGNQKFVVRAGFGLMYDRIYNNLFENIRFNPPYFSDNQIGITTSGGPVSPSLLTYPFTSTPVFASGFSAVPNPRHMDQNIVTPYYEQMHFGLQWEFAKGWVFEPEYVGTFGHKLTGIIDINTYDGRLSCAIPKTAYTSGACFNAGFPNGFPSGRPNPNVGGDNFRTNAYSSNYHALQMSLRRTYSSGLSVTANYTYSKALDALSDAFNGKNSFRPTDNMNPKNDYGPADFDLRHRIVATVGYDLPFMKSNRFIGGWGVNSIVSWQTGHPFSPYSTSSSYDLNKDGYRVERLVPTKAPMDTVLSNSSPGSGYFDPSAWERYSCPTSANDGLWCNPPIGRNSIFGPHYANVDFNISKKFKITERMGLTFQANFFDLFNHPNFLPPCSSGTTCNELDSNFGASSATTGDSGGHRVTQLALRFDF